MASGMLPKIQNCTLFFKITLTCIATWVPASQNRRTAQNIEDLTMEEKNPLQEGNNPLP
jgi:hypothetical protein